MDPLETSTLPMNASTVRVVLMPRIGYTIIAIIMATSCTLSVILNTTVIVVTIKYRQLRQPINYSLVNLAIADLGAALLGGSLNVETNAVGYYNLGRVGCVTEGFAMAFFAFITVQFSQPYKGIGNIMPWMIVTVECIVALCTIAVIAVDRAIVVTKPMGTLTFTTRKAMIGVAASWIWSLVWNTPPLFGWGGYQMEGVMTSCAPDWYNSDPINVSYIICYFLFCFTIPFVTILVSYGYLLRTLRQVAKVGVAQRGSTTKAEAQVSRMVIVMVMAFLICWLPYATFALVVVGNPQIYINPIIATVPMYMAKSSTFYNPIIYIFMNKQFRDCLVRCLLCGRNPCASEQAEEDDLEVSTIAPAPSSRHGKVSPM